MNLDLGTGFPLARHQTLEASTGCGKLLQEARFGVATDRIGDQWHPVGWCFAERSSIFNGKIHDFDWAMASIAFCKR